MDEQETPPSAPEEDAPDPLTILARNAAAIEALGQQMHNAFRTVLALMQDSQAQQRTTAAAQKAIETRLTRLEQKDMVKVALLLVIIGLILSSTLQRQRVIDPWQYYVLLGVLALLAAAALWRLRVDTDGG